MDETTYLMRSPKNAERLTRAAREIVSGRYETHEVLSGGESGTSQDVDAASITDPLPN